MKIKKQNIYKENKRSSIMKALQAPIYQMLWKSL